MIAYNRQSLDNLEIQKEAREAFEKQLLSADEYSRILGAHTHHFYLPNFFIRIGLFILTVIVGLFGLWILVLIDNDLGTGKIERMLIVCGVMAYGALELFIHKRKMKGSGVDDSLLWMASLFIVLGVTLYVNDSFRAVPLYSLILAVALFGMGRYADRGMTLVAYGAFLCLIFYKATAWGELARAILPFFVIALSMGLYLLFTRFCSKPGLRHYHSCFTLLRVATLISLYGGGNYFAVRELNGVLSGHSGPIALGWLFWAFTLILPAAYMVRGMQKKDRLFIWVGLATTTATIFTIRYYYHVVPVELVMIAGGIVLITGVYGIFRYLQAPKHGLTGAASDAHPMEHLPVEGIVLAESFRNLGAQPADPGVRFGGGSTGGGGAGGQY